MMVLVTVSLALVQSLAARMGVVTGKGLSELIRENYGIRWTALATAAVLIANTGICLSDFVGIGAAMGPCWRAAPRGSGAAAARELGRSTARAHRQRAPPLLGVSGGPGPSGARGRAQGVQLLRVERRQPGGRAWAVGPWAPPSSSG